MNKKGGHVDWVISFGIFILYIFALFILLRPGVRPVYRPTTLLDNLEENFRGDVMWTVKMVPLFVRICKGTLTETTSIVVDDPDNRWSVGRTISVSEDSIVSIPLECGGEEESHHFDEEINIYYYQKGLKFIPSDFLRLNLECFPIDESYCRAELGVMEDIEGIYSGFLNPITGDTAVYETLKESWGFPQEKGFSIYVDEGLDGSRNKIVGGEAGAQENVFVRRIETQFVDKDGETTPVAVYLQVW